MDKEKKEFGMWYLDNDYLYIICHSFNNIVYITYTQACRLNDIEGDKVYFTLKEGNKDKFTKGFTMSELKYKYDNGLIYRIEKEVAATKLYIKQEDFDIDGWTLEKAKKDYLEKNPIVIERNCNNCKFYGCYKVTDGSPEPIEEYICLVSEKSLVRMFNGIRAKKCKYYTQRGDI